MNKLLIIDDDQSLRALVAWVVKSDFDAVVHAVDGVDGLDVAVREQPSVIVLDLDMPRMGGVEVCRRLRQIPDLLAVPILMLTAHATSTDVQAAITAGATDFMVKPFSHTLLRDRLRTWQARRCA